MTESYSNANNKSNVNQELNTVLSGQLGKATSKLEIDDSPFTLSEIIYSWLRAFDDASPPAEVWAGKLEQTLDDIHVISKETPNIAEGISDLGDKLDKHNEIAERHNDLLKEIIWLLHGQPTNPETDFWLKISKNLHGQTGLVFPGIDNPSTIARRATRTMPTSPSIKQLRATKRGS
jgi:hypothetical protein